MSGKRTNFDNKKNLKKSESYKNKKVFQIDDIDISKIQVCKYFTYLSILIEPLFQQYLLFHYYQSDLLFLF